MIDRDDVTVAGQFQVLEANDFQSIEKPEYEVQEIRNEIARQRAKQPDGDTRVDETEASKQGGFARARRLQAGDDDCAANHEQRVEDINAGDDARAAVLETLIDRWVNDLERRGLKVPSPREGD